MILIVDNKDINLYFIQYIKRVILRLVLSTMDSKKLSVFDNYFDLEEFKELSNNVKIVARKIIVLGLTNLIHKRYETTTHIFINPNICYPGTDIKLVDLCRIINFGNMSVEGYPIFTDVFNHISKNIQIYKERCLMGLG